MNRKEAAILVLGVDHRPGWRCLISFVVYIIEKVITAWFRLIQQSDHPQAVNTVSVQY